MRKIRSSQRPLNGRASTKLLGGLPVRPRALDLPSTRISLSLSRTRPTAGSLFMPMASRSLPPTLMVRWRMSAR